MKSNKGITLIALVITIIILLIIAGIGINTFSQSGLIFKTEGGVYKNKIKQFEEELILSIHEDTIEKLGNRTEQFNVRRNAYSSVEEFMQAMQEKIPSFTEEYAEKLEIKDDELVYIGLEERERKWLRESRIEVANVLKINYIDESGNQLATPFLKVISDDTYSIKSPEIAGYKTVYDDVEGKIEEDMEIDVVYYEICTNLVFTPLDSSGNVAANEQDIDYYMVGDKSKVAKNGVGDFSGKYLVIPDTYNGKQVKKISTFAFNGLSTIKVLILPKYLDVVDDRAFQGCTGLKQVRMPNGNLPTLSFYGCTNLEEVIVGDGKINIGSSVFYNCQKLSKFIIKTEDFTMNGYGAFASCNSLKEITVNFGNNTYYSDSGILYTKDKTKLVIYPVAKDGTNFEIPNSVNEICYSAFAYNQKIKVLTIPHTVNKIADRGVEGCVNLETVYIAASSTGQQAFYSCKNLKYVEFNGENINLGVMGFASCTNLEDFIFNNSNDIRIADYNLIRDCSKIKKIQVGENNTKYTVDQYGVLYSDDWKNIVLYPVGNELTEYVIPDSVTSIGKAAFHNAVNLTRMTVPEKVETISERAFEDCDGLTEVVINSKNIGTQAFYSCDNLSSMTLSENVNSIGWNALAQNANLNGITYNSTKENWDKVTKATVWKTNSPITSIVCTDGTVTL